MTLLEATEIEFPGICEACNFPVSEKPEVGNSSSVELDAAAATCIQSSIVHASNNPDVTVMIGTEYLLGAIFEVGTPTTQKVCDHYGVSSKIMVDVLSKKSETIKELLTEQ